MRQSSPTVITGIGCVSPVGDTEQVIWSRLVKHCNGFRVMVAGKMYGGGARRWCAGWVPKSRIRRPPSVLTSASKSGVMAYQAVQAALQQASLAVVPRMRSRIAVVLGTCFGSIQSVHAFDANAQRYGNRHASAMLFPNTVINAPAGYVGASMKFRGPNLTVSTGLSSGFSAIGIGQELLHQGEAEVVLAGGYDELSPLLLSILDEEGFVRPAPNRSSYSLFESQRDCSMWVPGEGCAVFVLESRRRALARRANILAQVEYVDRISSTASLAGGLADRLNCYLGTRHEVKRVGLFLGLNGSKENSRGEIEAFDRLCRFPTTVSVPKALLGEAGGANVTALAVAVWSLRRRIIPACLRLELRGSSWEYRLAESPLKQQLGAALVSSHDPQGEDVGILVTRWDRGH